LSPHSEERVPELSRRRKLLVLAVCCSSLFIVGLDVTVLNVALPSIQHDLHAPVSGLQWTVDAYTLVVASFLILAGSTGDRIGRRRTFQAGLATFTVGSLLCSLAPGLGWLIAFRAVQAIGGSMLNPVALSIIANTFTDDRERARALGVWGAVFGLSMALGPVLGGVLVATTGWRGIFWVNIPVGIAAIVLTALVVPESRAARPRRVDPVGQVLIIVMLASLTYAIIEGPHLGWGSPVIIGLFALAALAAAGLGIYEPRRDDPLLDLRFFRSAPFSGAVVIAITAFSALAGFLFLNTLYLQDVRHLSALHAGLYTLPMAAMTVLLAPVAGRITGQRGPRLPLLVAGVMTTAGALVMVGVTATTPVAVLLLAYLAFGIGNGMVNPPISNTAVSGMPRAQAGVAAAVASTSRQVGGSLGVALTGSAVASSLHGPLRTGFVPASHGAWLIIAGCCVLVLVAGLATTGRWARATAARTAHLLMSDEDKVPVTAGSGVGPGGRDH
jgi:EmrB/QacA subfamily drug resistance transporter